MSEVGCSHTTWLQPRAPQELRKSVWVSKHRRRRLTPRRVELLDWLSARQSEHELVVDPLTIPAASPSERRRVRVSQRCPPQPPATTLHLHRRAAIAAARDAARRVR